MKMLPLSLALVSVLAASAAAQTAGEGTVSSAGTATIERAPQTMRMRVDVISKAGTMKEAVAGLKKQLESARKQAAELGAEAKSIQVEPPRVSGQVSQQQRQMQMMLQRLGRGGRAQPQVAVPATVSATLTAEWPLESGSPEDLLLSVHSLQEKIREADLGGAKAAAELSPEQQELLEEMEDQLSMYGGDEQQPGQPVFVFVSPISEEDREKALAQAFAHARAEAARLAKAAGAELGALQSLSSHASPLADGFDYDLYGGYGNPLLRSLQSTMETGNAPPEALGTSPGPVKLTVSVTASFALRP